MPAESRYKICPHCQKQADLDAAFCAGCGRKYKTQFVNQSVMDRTKAFRVGDTPGVGFDPDSSTPPRSASVPPTSAGNSFALAEYERQYRGIVIWQVLAVVSLWGPVEIGSVFGSFIPFGIVPVIVAWAIAIVLFARVVAAKPAIRLKVAEAGVDPVEWARPIDRAIGTVLAITVWLVAGIIVLFAVGLVAAGCNEKIDLARQQTQQEQAQQQRAEEWRAAEQSRQQVEAPPVMPAVPPSASDVDAARRAAAQQAEVARQLDKDDQARKAAAEKAVVPAYPAFYNQSIPTAPRVVHDRSVPGYPLAGASARQSGGFGGGGMVGGLRGAR